MAQHYLLSPQSKQLSIKQICRLTDEQAFQMLKAHRWGNPNDINDVCCPFCGIRHHAYFLRLINALYVCRVIPYFRFIIRTNFAFKATLLGSFFLT